MAKLIKEQTEEAKALRAQGWTCKRIAEQFGVHRQTIQRIVDAEYQTRRCQQVREARLLREAGVRNPRAGRENATSMSIKADFAARLAEIPPDRRTNTQRICGDPLFERSALFKSRGLT